MNAEKRQAQVPGQARRPAPTGFAIYARLEREIHGLMVDLGLDEQRRDEFLDQEGMVKRFMEKWAKTAEKIQEKVLKQIEAGKEISF
jgi:polysaccharide pyruvyl transferase WcaK-like protein